MEKVNFDGLVKSLSFQTYRGIVLGWTRNTEAFAVFSADHLCWHCHFAAFCTGFWTCQRCIGRHGNVYFFCGENIAKRFWKKISCFEYLLTPFFSFACRVWRNGFIKPAEFFFEFTAISIIFIARKPEGPFAWAVKNCICVFPIIFDNQVSFTYRGAHQYLQSVNCTGIVFTDDDHLLVPRPFEFKKGYGLFCYPVTVNKAWTKMTVEFDAFFKIFRQVEFYIFCIFHLQTPLGA